MAKKTKTEEAKFRNVGLLIEDHEKLRELSDREQRSMARQLSVLIRKEFDKLEEV
jgi:hypothetical protein|tara:strand:- start:2868 stop:3032 length:165 start_codon:yes stop_codon:yes gene_type:complete